MPHNGPFSLAGKVALVTGGSSGIGLAIAKAFVRHGAKVVIGSRSIEKVEAAVNEINHLPEVMDEEPHAGGLAMDVQNQANVGHTVKKTVDLFGRLDILVNSAGIGFRKAAFDLKPEDFNQVYDTHVTGSLRCAQVVGHLFREQHSGCIINIASMASYVDVVETAAYAAAKNAVIGLTRSLANEWAKFGVRTNAIAPGFIPSETSRAKLENSDLGRRVLEHTPMNRFGIPDEVATGAVFLASPAASFINGHVLVIDGGYLACGISDHVAPWDEPK